MPYLTTIWTYVKNFIVILSLSLPCWRVNILLYRWQHNVDDELAEPDDGGQHDEGEGLPKRVKI